MRTKALITIMVTMIGFALVTGAGILWPEWANGIQIAAIVWALLAFVGTIGVFSLDPTPGRLAPGIAVLLMAPALIFGMVGSASLGPDLAVRQRSEVVNARVVMAEPHTQQGTDSSGRSTTTEWVVYRFTRDGKPIPGELTYRGSTKGYGFRRGDTVKLLVDPQGRLPLMLDSEADTSAASGELILAGLGLLVWWVIVCVLNRFLVRRRARRDELRQTRTA